jgi:hypothetical protein
MQLSCKLVLSWQKNEVLSLKKKHKYYGQVQLGMAVLGLKKCDFIMYSS